MNLRLVSRMLSVVSMLIGGTMIFSLPWAYPTLGVHTTLQQSRQFETAGFNGLVISMVICFAVGGVLFWFGRNHDGKLFRKEAMAVVGLSWIVATVLGGLPFYLSGTTRGPSVRTYGEDQPIFISKFNWQLWSEWDRFDSVLPEQYAVLEPIVGAGAPGLSVDDLIEQLSPKQFSAEEVDRDRIDSVLTQLRQTNPVWEEILLLPGDRTGPKEWHDRYRTKWVPMGVADCLFESQSGFSTTGATVLSDLENYRLVPHCILFWRSSTHFLGGLGIIVLFVTILGQGSAGKALMRAEMPGPTKEGSTARMQHTAWIFAGIYCALNFILATILFFCGMNIFDACCHAFGTMATGGFSTYNQSLGHFDSPTIEYVVIAFMILAGTNFTLLYLALLRKPGRLLADLEWRTYAIAIILVTAAVMGFGIYHGDFGGLSSALRYGLFQVVSIITTTGYGTDDFDSWNNFGRGILFLLMFIGGCAGSTGGGMKVIRHVLFILILRQEIERVFHPRVVRPLRLGGRRLDDPELKRNIMTYFSLILILFINSWLFMITMEPDSTWGNDPSAKLIDCSTAVAATLNNIGPGLGTVGATQNYGHFTGLSKTLFVWLMMIGRLEIFSIIVLFMPSFWRDQ